MPLLLGYSFGFWDAKASKQANYMSFQLSVQLFFASHVSYTNEKYLQQEYG